MGREGENCRRYEAPRSNVCLQNLACPILTFLILKRSPDNFRKLLLTFRSSMGLHSHTLLEMRSPTRPRLHNTTANAESSPSHFEVFGSKNHALKGSDTSHNGYLASLGLASKPSCHEASRRPGEGPPCAIATKHRLYV